MANRIQRGNRYRQKIFLAMILTAVLPVIILGLYSYHTYVTELSERKDLSMQTTANQVKSRVDNILDSVKQYYSEVENKDEIKELIYAKDLYYNQYSRLKQGIDVLSGPIYLRDYIQGYTFVNFPENWVVSNYGMYRYDEMSNASEIMGFLEDQRESRAQCYWINRMGQPQLPVIPAGRNVILSGYVMALRLPMLSVEDKCLLLINLNDVKLKNLIAENLGDMDVTVINTRGELVYSSNPAVGEYCSGHVDEIAYGGVYSDVKLADGSNYSMAVTPSAGNGLLYIASYDVATVKEGADQILSLAAVLLLVICLVLVFAQLGTRVIYTPMSRLKAQFNEVLDIPQSGGDEFAWMEKGLNQLVENKESLERMVENQKKMLVELFLTRLIRGELTQERIDEDVERFNLQKKACYVVLSMGLVQKESTLDSLEQDALLITVMENIPQELCMELFARPVLRKNVMFFILGADSEEELEKNAEQLFIQMCKYVQRAYGCYLHCGVSRIFYKLKHLRIAHTEGIEALKNSESLNFCENLAGGIKPDSEKAISFYSDLSKNEQPAYQYDLFAEQEIRKAVDGCQKEAAFEIVDRFINKMLEKGVSRQDRYFFLHRFLVAILQVASEAGLSMNQIFEQEEVNLFLSLDSIVEPENIRHFYKTQIIEPVIKNLTRYRRSHSVDIMEQVLALVKEKNGDITLAECAEQLNYHPSYIWRVLKTEKNMTFTDFVALEKLEMAKEMLMHTSLPVSEIALKLNYTNTQNFIRFFSKHEGITPGKYRQEQKKEG